jgi:hypothetical protein
MPPILVIDRTDLRAHRLVFLPLATSGGSRVADTHEHEGVDPAVRAGAGGVLTGRSSPAERGNVVGLHG